MSFRITPAHSSSRIQKPRKPPAFNRAGSSSGPFSSLARRKPFSASKSKDVDDDDGEDYLGDRLDDCGLVEALATDLTLRDVAQAIVYIRSRMFTPVPDRGAGMNSTRIAEVLNFRKSLPPIVTVAHVKALLRSPTAVEREIAHLVAAGALRKIVIPGRGGAGEALILVKDLETMIQSRNDLDASVRQKFIDVLRANPSSARVPRIALSADEATALMSAGFLTASSSSWNTTDAFSRPGDGSRGTLTSIHSISKAASGSLAAVGGEGAVHAAGGSGGRAKPLAGVGDFQLAIPSTGPYLKLLTNCRAHLVSLLSKSRFRESPETMLRERWDGGVVGDDNASLSKKARGEYAGVLPGRTRKWKQHYGASFDWVLGECVGAGMVEVFETRSVGRGVRVC